jgi:DNA-binding transcriptional LysR family regulator
MASIGAETDHVSWDDLRTALSLAERGSVRGAARALGVSHSTVLRRIAALESVTSVRLFERKPEGYELTPAGQDVFDTARAVEDLVVALERRVEGRDLRLSGPIRVTLPDPFLPFLLPVFREFGRAHPEIEVTLAVGVGYADLAHREADVAIRTTSEPPPDLVGRRVAEAGVAIYGSKRYLSRRSTRDLEALDWIGWEEGSAMAFAQWMRKCVPRARVALRVTTSWVISEAIDADLGVALLPCATGSVKKGWQQVRQLKEASAPLWILTHKDLRTTARVRALRDFLADAIGRQRGLIEGRSQ